MSKFQNPFILRLVPRSFMIVVRVVWYWWHIAVSMAVFLDNSTNVFSPLYGKLLIVLAKAKQMTVHAGFYRNVVQELVVCHSSQTQSLRIPSNHFLFFYPPCDCWLFQYHKFPELIHFNNQTWISGFPALHTQLKKKKKKKIRPPLFYSVRQILLPSTFSDNSSCTILLHSHFLKILTFEQKYLNDLCC